MNSDSLLAEPALKHVINFLSYVSFSFFRLWAF